MDEKKKRAEALLDAIGEIDEAYLAEALSYKKRRSHIGLKLLVAAAIMMLATVIPLTAIVGASVICLTMLGGIGFNQGQAENEDQVAEDEGFAEDRLSFLMAGVSDSGSFKLCEDEEDIPYADGNAYLVWQIEGESGYYMSEALDDSDVNDLKANMGHGKQVGANSPKLKCKVWLVLEDGRVISPYLKASAGNISNSVFDYEAEITPTEALADRISDILN